MSCAPVRRTRKTAGSNEPRSSHERVAAQAEGIKSSNRFQGVSSGFEGNEVLKNINLKKTGGKSNMLKL